MIFSFQKPKSQTYRTAQFEATKILQKTSDVDTNSHINNINTDTHKNLTRNIYKNGSANDVRSNSHMNMNTDTHKNLTRNIYNNGFAFHNNNTISNIKPTLKKTPETPETPETPDYPVNEEKIKKILVLFVYHIYNKRVKNFIYNCIFYDENIDFIIISNNKNNKNNKELNDILNVTNVENKNVKMLFRDNVGYDFGGWSDALLTDNLYEKYNNFIFVNSSVIGPFLRPGYKGKWTDIYINGLKDNVKLFGSTINTMSNPLISSHVQSYIFSMDKTTLKYLIDCSIFSINYAKTFQDAIHNKEILMSRKIIENNWNIGSLMKYYNNIDFTFCNKNPKDYNVKFFDDVMYQIYRKKIWNEYELVFIKGNRNIILV